MIRNRTFAMLALPVFALGICIWQAKRLVDSKQEYQHAQASTRLVAQELAELTRLEVSSQQITWGARPEADVLALARTAVSDAGLPSGTLQGVIPTGDRPVPGQPNTEVQLREQSVRINLRSVTAPTLGSFLRAWQNAAPRWTVTSIEMTAGNTRGSRGGTFATTLIVTAPYAQGGTP